MKKKRKRAVFLALSGLCAALSVAWILWIYFYTLLWIERHMPKQYDNLFWLWAPVVFFSIAAALCFLLGFAPSPRNGKLRAGVWVAAGVLLACWVAACYTDILPPLPFDSRILLLADVTAAPLLAALGVLLGHKPRNHMALKIARGAAAALLIGAASFLWPIGALVLFGMH